MKSKFTFSMFLGLVFLCSQMKPTPLIAGDQLYTLHPWNSPESCVYFSSWSVSNYLVDPPEFTTRFSPWLVPCTELSPTDYHLKITNLDGKPWVGGYDRVQIKITSLGTCMTNIANYSTGYKEPGELRWENCKDPKTSPEEEYMRQFFTLHVDASGATQIISNLQYILGKPNAKQECVEFMKAPQQRVYRTSCNNLGNWFFKKVN